MQRCLLEGLKALLFGGVGGILAATIVGIIGTLWFDIWIDLYVFPVAIFFFVVAGCFCSSLNKRHTALVLAFISMVFAVFFVGETVHPKTYLPTYLPLLCVFFAAILASITVVIFAQKK